MYTLFLKANSNSTKRYVPKRQTLGLRIVTQTYSLSVCHRKRYHSKPSAQAKYLAILKLITNKIDTLKPVFAKVKKVQSSESIRISSSRRYCRLIISLIKLKSSSKNKVPGNRQKLKSSSRSSKMIRLISDSFILLLIGPGVSKLKVPSKETGRRKKMNSESSQHLAITFLISSTRR